MIISNPGNKTKAITIIVPVSADVIDITYYWKTAGGRTIKSNTTLMDRKDGERVDCFLFPKEDGESDV